MRIAIDATPAIEQSAGVGRYTRELLRALLVVAHDDQFVLSFAAARARIEQFLDQLPPGAWREARRLPLPQRAMTIIWHRLGLPPAVEHCIGHFDIYHATDFVAPPSRRPVVVTVHDLSFLIVPHLGHPRLVAYLRAAVPRTLARAAVVITVSASVAAEIADAYPFVRNRIVAVPNGVALPSEVPARSPSGRPTILIVGTLEPRKNHAIVFDALPEVRANWPDARLVVAGRVGWQSAPIQARLRELVEAGMAEQVIAPSDTVLETLFALADVCVIPSYYEGFGLPLLEAMARGVPVVASDIAALREIGGEAALYVDPADAAGWAAAISRVVGDETLRRRLATAGIARSRAYSWQETARRTRRAYELAGR